MKHAILFIVIINFCCLSCSTTKEKTDRLALAKKMDGVYLANGLDTVKTANYSNFIKLLDRKLMKDTLYPRPIKEYSFEVLIVDTKTLKIKLFDESQKFISAIDYKYDYQKDGFFILRNKNVKPLLIPYVIGAIDIRKVRIKSDADGNLKAKILDHRSGGLFLIPMGWTTTKDEITYRQVKN